MADLFGIVGGELENVGGYVLQHRHNVHRHLQHMEPRYSSYEIFDLKGQSHEIRLAIKVVSLD